MINLPFLQSVWSLRFYLHRALRYLAKRFADMTTPWQVQRAQNLFYGLPSRLLFCLLLSACAPGFSSAPNAAEGVASWYGPGFDGNLTANGEVFDTTKLTAAHQTLPFDTLLRVTNLENGLVVVVRIQRPWSVCRRAHHRLIARRRRTSGYDR